MTHDTHAPLVDARDLLGAFAAAENHARYPDADGHARPQAYSDGAADAFAAAQTTVRKLADLPVEAESDRM